MVIAIFKETKFNSPQLSLSSRLQLLLPLNSRSLCFLLYLHLFPLSSKGRVVKVQTCGCASVCPFQLPLQNSCGYHHIQRIVDPPPNILLLFELPLDHIKSTRSSSEGSNLSTSAATSWWEQKRLLRMVLNNSPAMRLSPFFTTAVFGAQGGLSVSRL